MRVPLGHQSAGILDCGACSRRDSIIMSRCIHPEPARSEPSTDVILLLLDLKLVLISANQPTTVLLQLGWCNMTEEHLLGLEDFYCQSPQSSLPLKTPSTTFHGYIQLSAKNINNFVIVPVPRSRLLLLLLRSPSLLSAAPLVAPQVLTLMPAP
jgi:hypothetical protein